MVTKLFEVRAEATCIPIIATRLTTNNEQERWLLARSGYGTTAEGQAKYIMVARLEGKDQATTEAYEHQTWELQVVHEYLNKHFDEMAAGAVLDVDFIQGKEPVPRKSDRFWTEEEEDE